MFITLFFFHLSIPVYAISLDCSNQQGSAFLSPLQVAYERDQHEGGGRPDYPAHHDHPSLYPSTNITRISLFRLRL
jgi:hypothetical protein